MANRNVLDLLYNKRRSALDFNFDMLWAPPLLSLLTPADIYELNKIAKSIKLSGKIDEKYRLIDMIMRNRGFVKLHAGTNRVVYRFLEDQRFVIKIAVDRVGLGDNPAEYKNQFLLKPFVTKVFEVSPCGTVAVVERVNAIMSREEFISVADNVFDLITKFFVGKYVLEDFGSHYFMNYGIRDGFGPVLLDYPYVFELDGNKLYCNAKPIPRRRDIVCGGEIDYDDGFNNLICTKCGRQYNARDLSVKSKDKLIIVGGKKKMRVQVKRGNVVIKDNKQEVTKTIEERKPYSRPIKNGKAKFQVQGRNKNTKPDPNKNKMPSESILNNKESLVTNTNKPEDYTVEGTGSNIHVEARYNLMDKDGKRISAILPSEEIKTKSEIEAEEKDLDMNEELDEALKDQDYDEYDEDDYDEYDQYLNNRQRSSKIKPKMKSSKKNSFDGF